MSHIDKVMVNININQETIYTKIPHSQTCAALLVHFMLQPYIITYILQEFTNLIGYKMKDIVMKSNNLCTCTYYHIETCFLLKFK